MSDFRERAAIAIFVASNESFRPPIEENAADMVLALVETSASAAHALAVACCKAWGHDGLVKATGHSDARACHRCGATR